jgi:hypothetical protein
MNGEIDIFGVYVPELMVLAAISFVLVLVCRRLLACARFYEHVWHRSLFDVSLFVVLLGLMALVSHEVFA